MTRAKSKPEPKPKLTPSQEKFCATVASGRNHADSYRIAYPNSKANNTTTANAAYKLSQIPHVAARLAELRNRAALTHEITVERIQLELSRLALFDPSKCYDDNGNLKPLHEMDEDTRRAIAGIDMEPIFHKGFAVGEKKKVRAWDKKGALDSLARIKGMFQDRIEVTGNFADKLVKARERARAKSKS